MSRYNEIGKTATAHCEDNNGITVIYHKTCVVRVDKKSKLIYLNSGGWWTKTTALRMNQASNHYCLGFSVYVKKGQWYVDYKGITHKFDDNMLVLDMENYKE